MGGPGIAGGGGGGGSTGSDFLTKRLLTTGFGGVA